MEGLVSNSLCSVYVCNDWTKSAQFTYCSTVSTLGLSGGNGTTSVTSSSEVVVTAIGYAFSSVRFSFEIVPCLQKEFEGSEGWENG